MAHKTTMRQAAEDAGLNPARAILYARACEYLKARGGNDHAAAHDLLDFIWADGQYVTAAASWAYEVADNKELLRPVALEMARAALKDMKGSARRAGEKGGGGDETRFDPDSRYVPATTRKNGQPGTNDGVSTITNMNPAGRSAMSDPYSDERKQAKAKTASIRAKAISRASHPYSWGFRLADDKPLPLCTVGEIEAAARENSALGETFFAAVERLRRTNPEARFGAVWTDKEFKALHKQKLREWGEANV